MDLQSLIYARQQLLQNDVLGYIFLILITECDFKSRKECIDILLGTCKQFYYVMQVILKTTKMRELLKTDYIFKMNKNASILLKLALCEFCQIPDPTVLPFWDYKGEWNGHKNLHFKRVGNFSPIHYTNVYNKVKTFVDNLRSIFPSQDFTSKSLLYENIPNQKKIYFIQKAEYETLFLNRDPNDSTYFLHDFFGFGLPNSIGIGNTKILNSDPVKNDLLHNLFLKNFDQYYYYEADFTSDNIYTVIFKTVYGYVKNYILGYYKIKRIKT